MNLKDGFKVRIGNETVPVWYDKWIGNDLLCNLVPFVNIQNTNLQLKDIYDDGNWYFERLAT